MAGHKNLYIRVPLEGHNPDDPKWKGWVEPKAKKLKNKAHWSVKFDKSEAILQGLFKKDDIATIEADPQSQILTHEEAMALRVEWDEEFDNGT